VKGGVDAAEQPVSATTPSITATPVTPPWLSPAVQRHGGSDGQKGHAAERSVHVLCRLLHSTPPVQHLRPTVCRQQLLSGTDPLDLTTDTVDRALCHGRESLQTPCSVIRVGDRYSAQPLSREGLRR
jgi:hypothetical protein